MRSALFSGEGKPDVRWDFGRVWAEDCEMQAMWVIELLAEKGWGERLIFK